MFQAVRVLPHQNRQNRAALGWHSKQTVKHEVRQTSIRDDPSVLNPAKGMADLLGPSQCCVLVMPLVKVTDGADHGVRAGGVGWTWGCSCEAQSRTRGAATRTCSLCRQHPQEGNGCIWVICTDLSKQDLLLPYSFCEFLFFP